MAVDDYDWILQWHPELVLVCENPMTWEGFMSNLSLSNCKQSTRFKIKLSVPHYPILKDAKLNFNKKIAYLHGTDFNERVIKLIEATSRVSSFLTQLQLLLNTYMDDVDGEVATNVIKDNTTGVIQELEKAFQTPSEVQLLSDSSLDVIKLSLRNVSLKLQRTKDRTRSWMAISSDLPEIPAFLPFEKNVFCLNNARKRFKLQVERLEISWQSLHEIDRNCNVMDPVEPKPCHLYRRIYLTPCLSMLVNIDPLNPMDLPKITFLGSETEIEERKNIVSKKMHNWDPNTSMLNNLKMILDIENFPQKERCTNVQKENVIVADEECCICFSLEVNNEKLPDKVCNNRKCRRHFHTCCLLEWLKGIANNQVVFNHIYGACPHCGENIFCSID